ncbi:MAG: methylmalonyl Co-A mutase-associated GTPase MeaB [Holophagales bacterium]|nr:methylmalonyl Co-A mutase-associated GTPase MeaB [Holophagales bacterium]
MNPVRELAERVLAGTPPAIARAITWAETSDPRFPELLSHLWPRTGRARVIGLTGAPGAGKSTLTAALAKAARAEGRKVGIVAVDPSSPFTGGAILGDRIRMQDLYTDPGVMIRSMATRGHLGGVSRATADAVDVFDAAGFDDVLVETVGVGQDEVEVFRLAETCVVLLTPGMGDDIQAIKAGLMEVADVFVVNKADRDGADRTVGEVLQMLELGEHGAWIPPVLKTVARTGDGVDGLRAELAKHRDFLSGPRGRPAAGTGRSGGSRRSSRRGSSPSSTAFPAARRRWPPGQDGSRRGARTRSAPRRRCWRRSAGMAGRLRQRTARRRSRTSASPWRRSTAAAPSGTSWAFPRSTARRSPRRR